MAAISLVGNQAGQAYGQDPMGGFYMGSVVKATVVEQLGDNLYLLNIGNKTIEAKVSTELQEGVEYQFIVDKSGPPPELSVLTDAPSARDKDGLTAQEGRFVDNLARLMGKSADEVNRKELMNLIRSLGFDTEHGAESVYAKVKDMLVMISRMDAASPALRQTLAQTLLFTMQSVQFTQSQLPALNHDMLESTIKLSGEVPAWDAKDIELLVRIKQSIEQMPVAERKDMRSLLLGLGRGAGSEDKLQNRLAGLLGDPGISKGEQERTGWLESTVRKIAGDMNSRFFLASSRVSESSTPLSISTNLDRQTAINSYQQQAPGLADKSISSLLEQYVSLGGKLEKLNMGDVMTAKMSWNGNTPTAMQVHRTGALLYLAQDLPGDSRNYSESPMAKTPDAGKFPIILDKNIANDPAGSSKSLKNLGEFTHNSKLPDSYNVTRLLQIWTRSGGKLGEIRPQVDSIKAWDEFVEKYTNVRNKLIDYLMKNPAFVAESKGFMGDGTSKSALETMPQTREALAENLEQKGIKQMSPKSLQDVAAIVQQVAGEGQVPSKELTGLAAWMLSKNMTVNVENLTALLQFQGGNKEGKEYMENLQQLKTLLDKMPGDLKDLLGKAWLDLQDGGKDLKAAISTYQKGNGKALQEVLQQLQQHLQGQQGRDAQQALLLVGQLANHLKTQEDYLSGLKQYNIQAQRNDTPQVFEIPVVFGGEMEKAFIKIFKRSYSQKNEEGKDQYKVVIDLDLEGLGKVRSEVSLFNKHLQLDFLTTEKSSLDVLKTDSSTLSERLDALNINASMGFKLNKNIAIDQGMTAENSLLVPANKSAVDFSA